MGAISRGKRRLQEGNRSSFYGSCDHKLNGLITEYFFLIVRFLCLLELNAGITSWKVREEKDRIFVLLSESTRKSIVGM